MKKNKLFVMLIVFVVLLVIIISPIFFVYFGIKFFNFIYTFNNDDSFLDGYYKKESWKDPVSSREVTEYTKYYYHENADEKFKQDYNQISSVDEVNEVKAYFEDFIKWMDAFNKKEDFNFDLNDIDIGDYADIYTSDKSPNRKFYDYTVSYYDTEKHILYYIRSNN